MSQLPGLSVDEVLSTTRSVRRRLDLQRAVEDEVLLECIELAQQAPSQSDSQNFHFIVVKDREKRAGLGELFRRGHDEFYVNFPGGLYHLRHEDPKREAARLRAIAAVEHLVAHISEVPVHVIPCVEGVLSGDQSSPERQVPAHQLTVFASVLFGSVIPATWSFMLAARSRGLATCWTNLHMLYPEESSELLELPDGITQVALIPTAYLIGDGLRPGYRRPLREIVHYDTW